MTEPVDRPALRQTFEQAASTYHAARPRYPDELYDRLHALSGLVAPANILEVGPASGIATVPLAQRGHHIVAVELGEQLAAEARRNTADFPDVEVVTGSFDTWEPRMWGAFDLVVAATAWHWLDPATKYDRAGRMLRPRGHLAVWSATHVVPEGGDPFFAAIQDVYDEIGESRPGDRTFLRPGELPDLGAEIEAGGFDIVGIEHLDWEIEYDADGYLALLDTFSGHLAMESWKRERLYSAIRQRLAERPDGRLRRHWGCVLHVARRS